MDSAGRGVVRNLAIVDCTIDGAARALAKNSQV